MNRLFMALPFAELASYRGRQEIQNFVEEYLADNLHVDPTKHQVAGGRVSWIVRASSNSSRDKPVEGRAEALFREGRESLCFRAMVEPDQRRCPPPWPWLQGTCP